MGILLSGAGSLGAERPHSSSGCRLKTPYFTASVSKSKGKLLCFPTAEASRVALKFPRKCAGVWFVSASWSSIPSLQAFAFCRQAARGADDRFSMAVLFV